jgi:hypothetical protein
MRERIVGNWVTTVIGVPVELFGWFMIVCKILNAIGYCCPSCDFKITEIVFTVVLGWAFIVAKDTLIEGLTLGFFKLKK